MKMKPNLEANYVAAAVTPAGLPSATREKKSLAELLARSMEDDALEFNEPTANDSFDDDCSSGG